MDVGSIYRRDRFLRGGDHFVVPRRAGFPAAGSPSRTRTSRTSTRTSGSRTACSSATCRSSATSTSSPGRRGERRLAVVAGPGARAAARTSLIHLGSPMTPTLHLDAPTRPPAGYEIVWRPTTDPDWTHPIPFGEVAERHRRPVEGQRRLRGPCGRRRRPPQPGGVPVPRLVTRCSPLCRLADRTERLTSSYCPSCPGGHEVEGEPSGDRFELGGTSRGGQHANSGYDVHETSCPELLHFGPRSLVGEGALGCRPLVEEVPLRCRRWLRRARWAVAVG